MSGGAMWSAARARMGDVPRCPQCGEVFPSTDELHRHLEILAKEGIALPEARSLLNRLKVIPIEGWSDMQLESARRAGFSDGIEAAATECDRMAAVWHDTALEAAAIHLALAIRKLQPKETT
jgi:hypothetical protein